MTSAPNPEVEIARLKKRLERERQARLEAETIAEQGLRSLYEKQQELELLESIAVAANQANSLHEILELVMSRICQFSHWPIAHAYLRDSHLSTRLYPSQTWYRATRYNIQAFCELTEKTYVNYGEDVSGQAMATGESTWLELNHDCTLPRQQAALACGIKTAFALPILAGKQVIAVIEFFHHLQLRADPKLSHLLSQVGLQLGRIADRQLAEARLLHDAFHDPLTKLPNRAFFLDRLQRAIARRQRFGNYKFAVLFIDLDRFKVINDSLGHAAGDSLIRHIAERLSTALQEKFSIASYSEFKSVLARAGSDEFVLLLEYIENPQDVLTVIARIHQALATPFVIHEQALHVSISIGVASPDNQLSADDILRNADLAMYEAKRQGGGNVQFFDQTMHDKALKRLLVENDIRHALQQQQFVLFYQPIVSLQTGHIVGVEALIRWQKTPDKLIFPNDFIFIAEESGLITQIDMWVLRQACQTVQSWQKRFPNQPLTVSVNLSARSFALPNIVEIISHTLAETGVRPSAIRLEITESMTMNDTEKVIAMLVELREMGLHLSIDDFGTGYSSLSYLHRFPADILKIDRSFVSRMDESYECLQIINSIMSLARNLNMKVIAEGPETEAHVQQLQELDCNFGQGYFFSRPISQDQLEALLTKQWSYNLPHIVNHS